MVQVIRPCEKIEATFIVCSKGESKRERKISMPKWIKRLFCKHPVLNWVRNVHGDEINLLSTSKKIARSLHECEDCGKWVTSDSLFLDPRDIKGEEG